MKSSLFKIVSVIAIVSMFFISAGSFSGKNILNAQSTTAVNSQSADSSSVVKESSSPVKNEAAEDKSPEGKVQFLYDWFLKGGLFMWPILICAALAMGLIIERFLFYKKAKLKPGEFIDQINSKLEHGTIEDVVNLCKENNLVISRVLLKGLKLRKLGLDHVEKGIGAAGAIEIASLEKGLSVLSAIGNIAPMIGFLGTVSGMITAFQSIAAADQVSARLVAGGIYEALITTEAGLIVAIPVLAFYNFFVHRIEAFVADIERISADIAEKLLGENG
jgi:biopolymer transport protein ExbB